MMRRPGTVLATCALALLTLAWSAAADIPLAYHVFGQDSCPAPGQTLPTPHNASVTVVQTVPTDDFADLPRVAFLVEYELDGSPPASRGTLIAKIKLQRAGGGTVPLGKIRARQSESGYIERAKLMSVSLREGDRVEWKIRFQNFAPVSNCFILFAGFGNLDAL